MKRTVSKPFFKAVIMNGRRINNSHKHSWFSRAVSVGVILTMWMMVPTDDVWAGDRSARDVSPHLQRPSDIPLERLDRPERPPVRLNINRAAPSQLQRLPGLGEVEAERISRGRPYKYKDKLITKEILSQDAYDKIKDLITAE